jgi:hypothetical protein
MATRTKHVYTHHAADPVLGIRVGSDACKRANEKGHPPRGAVMRYAKDLALYGAERNRAEDGSYRHARRSAVVKDSSRVRPRITLENVLAAERRYAQELRRGSDASIRGAIETGDLDGARADVTAAVRDASPEGERVRAAQERRTASARRAAKLAAKGGR